MTTYNHPDAPTVPQRKRTGSWNTFERRYRPIESPGTCGTFMFDTDELPQPYDEQYVWTVVDGSGNTLVLLPGYCFVNRLGYVITQVPWNDSEFSNTGYLY